MRIILAAAVTATGVLGALAPRAETADEAATVVTEASVEPVEEGRGRVTNLPLPRFVSLKTTEGNARRGPSLSHRIDWVFKRRDMPLIVTAEFGNWRRVEDQDGQGGWIHYSLLSGVRTVLIQENLAELHLRPDDASPVMARAEAGVVGRLGPCEIDWCRITAEGEKGWVHKTQIWGVTPEEIRD